MRQAVFLPASLLVTLLLFLLMAHLAGVGKATPLDGGDYTRVDLHRLKLDSDVQVREREPIPPPEIQPPQPPPPAAPSMAQPVVPDLPSVPLDVPAPTLAISMAVQTAVDLPAVPTEAVTSPATVSGISMNLNAKPVSRMNPQYPRRAQARRIEGFVVAEFTVDARGQVVPDSFTIVEANPPGVFEHEVQRALLRWRFTPLLEQGTAVPYRTRQRLEFKLES